MKDLLLHHTGFLTMVDIVTKIRSQLFDTWPELLEYEDTIHVVYPGFGRDHNRSLEEIVDEVLVAKAAGRTKFVFLEAAESFMLFDIIRLDRIIELLDNQIPLRDLIYWTGSIDSAASYRRMHDKVTVISSHYWEKFLDYSKDWPMKPYNVKIKTKNFLCFNHVQREHRVQLANQMLATGLIDTAFYSFTGHGDIKTFINSLPDDGNYEYVKSSIDRFPMELNYRETGEDAGKNITSDLKYYENSYFSVVTETIFFKDLKTGNQLYMTDDRLFLTEKTFKPIFAKHPFIITAANGHLSALRDLGYKTFHPYIDETYDTIEDDDKRLRLIQREISRLCRQTDSEWLEWQNNIKDIIEFNHKHLLARTDHRITKNVKKLFNGLVIENPDIHKQFFTLWPELLEYEDMIYVFFQLNPYHTSTEVEIANRIRLLKEQGITKFVFYHANETILPYNISKLHRVIDLVMDIIDPKDVFYVAGGQYSQRVYNSWVKENNWQYQVNILTCNFWEAFIDLETMPSVGQYQISNKTKKFLSFNKLNREHRIQLLDRLLENKRIDDGYYSFEGMPGWLNDLDHFKNDYKHIKANRDIFPLKLNITESRPNPINLLPDDLMYFDDSYFSLITETCFYQKPNGHHWKGSVDTQISEKTFKAIVCKHPFIIASTPNFLVELRKLGYRTFHPYIDETYDTIKDDTARLDAIVKEVDRLCNKTLIQWIEWQKHIKDIVEFNNQLFYMKQSHVITSNVLGLINDTSGN